MEPFQWKWPEKIIGEGATPVVVEVPDLIDYVLTLRLATLKRAHEKELVNVLPLCR